MFIRISLATNIHKVSRRKVELSLSSHPEQSEADYDPPLWGSLGRKSDEAGRHLRSKKRSNRVVAPVAKFNSRPRLASD